MRRVAGTASQLLQRALPSPAVPAAWLLSVGGPAVVLGSTQHPGVLVAEGAGVDVVQRRSGGGAVLVVPGDVLWIDVLVPAGDPQWCADVGRAFVWLGETWASALAAVGVDGARVHEGPARRSPLGDLVCFAGLGPGEVTVEGRKVVGLCQRRTRAGALFQCAALLRWDPRPLADRLGLGPADRAGLEGVAAAVPVSASSLERAFLHCLARR